MNLKQFREYRGLIMRKICQNQKIVDLLTDNEDSTATPDDLIKKHVYPFEFIPGTTEEGKSYISMLFSVPMVDNGMTSLICYLKIFIVTYSELAWAKDDDGVSCLRYDLISEEIDKTLNGLIDTGFKVELTSRKDGYQPMHNWHGTALTYEVQAWNRPKQSHRTEAYNG